MPNAESDLTASRSRASCSSDGASLAPQCLFIFMTPGHPRECWHTVVNTELMKERTPSLLPWSNKHENSRNKQNLKAYLSVFRKSQEVGIWDLGQGEDGKAMSEGQPLSSQNGGWAPRGKKGPCPFVPGSTESRQQPLFCSEPAGPCCPFQCENDTALGA